MNLQKLLFLKSKESYNSGFHNRVLWLSRYVLLLLKTGRKDSSMLEMGKVTSAQVWSWDMETMWCQGKIILYGISFAVTPCTSRHKSLNGVMERSWRRCYSTLSTQSPLKRTSAMGLLLNLNHPNHKFQRMQGPTHEANHQTPPNPR